MTYLPLWNYPFPLCTPHGYSAARHFHLPLLPAPEPTRSRRSMFLFSRLEAKKCCVFLVPTFPYKLYFRSTYAGVMNLMSFTPPSSNFFPFFRKRCWPFPSVSGGISRRPWNFPLHPFLVPFGETWSSTGQAPPPPYPPLRFLRVGPYPRKICF